MDPADAKSAIAALTECLRDKDVGVREAAADALKKMGPEAIPVLTKPIRDVLSRIGPKAKSEIPALIECLRDKDVGKREAAALVLGEMGSDAKSAIPALTECLRDKDEGVRRVAAYVLVRIEGDRE